MCFLWHIFKKIKKERWYIYLQIYECFYDPARKETAHHSIKPLGYVSKLIASGIKVPIAFYKNEVDKMNSERKEKNKKKRRIFH